MNRLTLKVNDEYITDDTRCMKNKYITKLGQLEDLMEKYRIESIEELEDTIRVKKSLELAFGKHRG